jgi:hypothetical protein
MDTTDLSLTDTKTLFGALPPAVRKSSAVRGWLASAEDWSNRDHAAAGLTVSIEFRANDYYRSFCLVIHSSCPYHVASASLYLTVEIPNPGQRIKRRTSTRRFDWVAGEKSHNAIWQIERNIAANIKRANA